MRKLKFLCFLVHFGLPVVIEAWMSKNVDLLYKSVRKQKDDGGSDYDPVKNLQLLYQAYPANCVYLSMLNFKQDWKSILPRLGAAISKMQITFKDKALADEKANLTGKRAEHSVFIPIAENRPR